MEATFATFATAPPEANTRLSAGPPYPQTLKPGRIGRGKHIDHCIADAEQFDFII